MSLSTQIEMLENFKKRAEELGCVELEVCSGCGQPGCDSCPCGTSFIVRNLEARKLRNVLKSVGITEPEKHPEYR